MKGNLLKATLLFLTAFYLTACSAKSTTLYSDEKQTYDYGEVKMESAAGAPSADMEGAVSSAAMASGEQVLPFGRKLVRNVSLNMETDSFDALINSLQAKIAEIGGYVEQSSISGNNMSSYGKPAPRYANLTARIPSEQMNQFLGTVEKEGNVTYKSESVEDLTLQYSDLESRKKSLETEQEKLWEFLEKAESVDTVITLHQRLSEIRYQLESMEAQLRIYDNQVDYSTAYIDISEVTVFTPTAPESAFLRIQRGFSRNVRLFINGAANFLIALIATIPLWLPVLAVGIGAALLVRRYKKKRKGNSSVLPKTEKGGNE